MPTIFRATFEFVQQAGFRPAGWTVNLWNNSASMDDMAIKTKRMAGALQKVVGKDTLLPWAGIRTIYGPPGTRGPRLTTTLYFLAPDQVSNLASTVDSDYPTTALGVELKAANGEAVRIALRAIPDQDVQKGGWWLPGGLSNTNLKAVFALLVVDGWQIYTQDSGAPFKPIRDFDSTTGTVFCPAYGINPDSIVKILGRNIGIKPHVNGKWRLSPGVDADHFVLRGYAVTQTKQPGNFNSAYAQYYNLTPKPIVYDITKAITTQATFVTEHKVGRPRKQLIGRRLTLK